MDTQPDYLKFVFKFILDAFKDFEREVGSEGISYSVKGTIEEVTNQNSLVCTYTSIYIIKIQLQN